MPMHANRTMPRVLDCPTVSRCASMVGSGLCRDRRVICTTRQVAYRQAERSRRSEAESGFVSSVLLGRRLSSDNNENMINREK